MENGKEYTREQLLKALDITKHKPDITLDESEMKISIVIPLYLNREELCPVIQRCFESIPEEDVELIVVDDASPLDTNFFRKMIEERETRWFVNSKNLGFTGTVNRGLSLARENILLVMNDDIILEPGQISRFFDISSDGIYSPRTTNEGPGDRFSSIWGMTRRTYEKLGSLEPSLKHFFSDTEYYDRAVYLGIPIVKWNDIVISHEGGKTYNTLTEKNDLYLEDQRTYNSLVSHNRSFNSLCLEDFYRFSKRMTKGM